MKPEPIKLMTDEDRERMKQNKGEILTLMEKYKQLEGMEKQIALAKEEIKNKLCPLVKEQGEKKTDKSSNYKCATVRMEAIVTSKRNIKFPDKNAFINYCRNANHADLIEVKEDIDRKRFTSQWDSGKLPNDISMFIEIDYTDSLQIKEL
jgi:hypothetical protein